MESSWDSWMREYNEASKIADDANNMISEDSSRTSDPESKSHVSAVRRKITILGTRLDSLDSLLTTIARQQQITGKELNKRQDMLASLRSKAKQLGSTLNASKFANREDLLGPVEKQSEGTERISRLDNHGVVRLQHQMIKEQDESLEKLEESISSTKHIALAVNEELDLHTRLIESLDQHVDLTASRLQRVQKRLGILNKKMRGGCSCRALLLAVIAIVFLAVVAWMLLKHL